MAYQPTSWSSGDVITSAKLNKIEQGIAGSILNATVTTTAGGMILDKTWQEIHDATLCVATASIEYSGAVIKQSNIILAAMSDQGTYTVYMAMVNTANTPSIMVMTLATDSADGYPKYGNP